MKQAYVPYLSSTGKSLETIQREIEQSGCRIFINTLNWQAEFPYQPLAVADVAYTEKGLLIHFFVHGEDLRTSSIGDGNYVHEDSCVEFFMQREEGENYINFEFNAAGICYASRHKTITVSERLTADEFSQIERIATYQGQRMEQTDGLFDWHVMAYIPWTLMGYTDGEIPTSLRANFYKCGDKTAHPHYLSWSPIEEASPAFHRPQFFGELILQK